MKVGTTVTALGAGSSDGEPGLLRVGTWPDQDDLRLLWNAGAQRWVSRPRLTLDSRAHEAFTFQPATSADWLFIFQSVTTGNGDWSLTPGTSIHTLERADQLWSAGFRLQEHLSGFCYSGGGASSPKVATWWYLFNNSGITNFFAYPNPFTGAGAGVELSGTSTRQWRSSGWQDSPVGRLGKRFAYPDFYGAITSGTVGDGRVENLTLHTRWVGDPTITTPSQPPVTSNLVLWADAAQEPRANNDKVYVWSDHSGNGNNLVAKNLAGRPTFITGALNGKPVIRFDGTANYLRAYFDNVAKAQPNTIFVVLKQYTGGAVQQVWFDGVPSTYDVNVARNLLYRFDATNTVSMYAGGLDRTYTSSSWTSPFTIYAAQFNGVSSQVWENLTSKLAADPGSQALSGLTLGATYTDALFAQIDVAEVLVYNAALNGTDRAAVTNWLNGKYAIY